MAPSHRASMSAAVASGASNVSSTNGANRCIVTKYRFTRAAAASRSLCHAPVQPRGDHVAIGEEADEHGTRDESADMCPHGSPAGYIGMQLIQLGKTAEGLQHEPVDQDQPGPHPHDEDHEPDADRHRRVQHEEAAEDPGNRP